MSFEDIFSKNLQNIFYYGIAEENKQFSIETVRAITSDMALSPYEWKHIFVLDNFDTASHAAQNAALKLIEDCPDYAVIILVVKNPKLLLGTIHSRTLDLFRAENSEILDEKTLEALTEYTASNPIPFIKMLYENEYSREEANAILTKVFFSLSPEKQDYCKKMLLALNTTNESPRNILENFFLT